MPLLRYQFQSSVRHCYSGSILYTLDTSQELIDSQERPIGLVCCYKTNE